MRPGFHPLRPGEWIHLAPGRNNLFECCGCGLVHEIEVRVVKRRGIKLRMWREASPSTPPDTPAEEEPKNG